MAVSVAWVADLWRSGAPLLVVGVDLVLDACPSAPSLLRRLFCRTGLGSLHLLVTGARRHAGALYSSQSYFIFDLIIFLHIIRREVVIFVCKLIKGNQRQLLLQ